MAALATVEEYVDAARELLQDEIPPYRYSDASLVRGLSFAMTEARRLRVDLFIGREDNVPSYSAADSTAVDFDVQYRTAVVYYMIGHAQLRDEEDTQDARAGSFLAAFRSKLTAI